MTNEEISHLSNTILLEIVFKKQVKALQGFKK